VAVLDGLIDHAALFPPASMPLDEALEEDRAARESSAASLIARFVVPARLLDELPKERPRLSVVLSGAEEAGLVEGVDDLEAVELALATPQPRPADLLAASRALERLGVEVYFELVLDEGWRNDVPAAIGAIAAIGGCAKLRCGGAYTPSVAQVALVVAACREAGVPFKCTAGLHHALRHQDPDGFTHHGFLNVLVATIRAFDGAATDEVVALLEQRDATALLHAAEDGDLVRARRWFTSFGSCSVTDPHDDLTALGLLEQP
jgi:hypothetical protein